MGNTKRIKYTPLSTEDKYPATIAVPMTITEFDQDKINMLTYGMGHSNTIYSKKTGRSYSQLYGAAAVTTSGGEVVIKAMSEMSFPEIKGAFAKHIPSVKELDCGKEVVKIHDASEVTIVPAGSKFKKYLSELRIAPIITAEGKLNTQCLTIVEYAENIGFPESEDEGGESHETLLREHFEGKFLIYHPQTGTRVEYEIGAEHPFHVQSLTTEYECDSLLVALVTQFDWAVDECDY